MLNSGESLREQAKAAQERYDSQIVAAELDHTIHDLQDPVPSGKHLEFVTLDSKYGWEIYRRSVIFLLINAVHDLDPEAEVISQFTANKGLFCTVEKPGLKLDASMTERIAARMREIVQENRPIEKIRMTREEAVQLFKRTQQIEKANLIAGLRRPMVSVYRCGSYYDYLYGAMLGSTGSLGRFALDFFEPGILLRTPDVTTNGNVRELLPQPKFSRILALSEEWAKILDCSYIPDLNRASRDGRINDIIRVSEALQEKLIARIADHIFRNRRKLRLILIAGPSSSGKTSFAQRLRVQMMVMGLRPVSISLDNYFKNRKDTPRNEKGEYDYENLGALDTDLFNKDMQALLSGLEAQMPVYNFLTGEREWSGEKLMITEDQPIIVEGIHGLNEALTSKIPRENKYKIYVSALTPLNIDAHNRIPTTDARLLRRLVRDFQFRGSRALKTLRQWPDVRAGEEKNIFPFQEEADYMFNSSMIYEIGVLRKYAVPLLEQISPDVPEHVEAQRLLQLCEYVDPITVEDEIPNNSLLREFIGKSVFFK